MASATFRNGGAGKLASKVDRLPPSQLATPKASNRSRASNATSGHGIRRSGSLSGTAGGSRNDTGVPGRVRVAVRLRPRNAEELLADSDFADCVELQPELKRLQLRKNNWESDTYEFDEVLTEVASQKRVYEGVAKPVVEIIQIGDLQTIPQVSGQRMMYTKSPLLEARRELSMKDRKSVLEGYNGTIMAYGQTGTGKTFTLGRLGEEDTAARGIMVRSMEDIISAISPESDSISVSYMQLYMETIQDLLVPGNDNIAIVEDPKTGDVSLPGATLVEIRDQKTFLDILRLGEAHRFAANTKLNTESSRSHAILMVHVKRSVKGRHERETSLDNGNSSSPLVKSLRPPIIRKSKLVVVDLAGSERIDKSGSEGQTLEEAKSINLSLSALGKCINALAENSPHVPFRDSKLTRLLRDSFGGTARTSLVITIGPSPRHRGETASTIMFGQRAMKVENMVKLKEEFDYKSMCRRLENELDRLIAENERQQKGFEDELARIKAEAQDRVSQAEKSYEVALENERRIFQKDYLESVKKLEEQWAMKEKMHDKNRSGEVSEINGLLQREMLARKSAEEEVKALKLQIAQSKNSESNGNSEVVKLHRMLEEEIYQKVKLEEEIALLKSQLLQLSLDADQTRQSLEQNPSNGLDSLMSQTRRPLVRDSANGQKASIAKLFEQVGLQKILSLLESEDADVRIHAVKVLANLAAEEANQQRIVEAGGLSSLLMLLRDTDDETIQRVAAGALANLAMNETNQELIMSQGGISLLAMAASNAEDPQTLRMVAGAIANLCGNDKLQSKLRTGGGIKALLGMVRCGHADVLAQVARGIANFAKCESRAYSQGKKTGRSMLIEDGALPWIIKNANNEASPIRRHIELALCHIAQHEVNAKDMVNEGALWELVRISRDCSREDIRSLAHRTLNSSATFSAELRRLRIEY